MIRENKIYADSLHVRIAHSLKMKLKEKAQDEDISLSELVISQLKQANE